MSAAHVIGRALGATLLVCGAHFLVRALTGKTPLEHVEAWLSHLKEAEEPAAAAHSRANPLRSEMSFPSPPVPPNDPVDEASWESFPASDPPAHSPKNA